MKNKRTMILLEFAKTIRESIRKGETENALELLFEQIGSMANSYANDILVLNNRFNLVKKDVLLGVIKHEEFQLINAQICQSILTIISKIENPRNFSINQKGGELLYKVPSNMKVHNQYRCVIRIAYNIKSLIKHIEIDENTKIENIQITDVMSVDLLDPNIEKIFQIRNCTDAEQFIIHNDFTQWLFFVKPLKLGRYTLVLKIATLEQINEKERKRNITFEKKIEITNTINPIEDIRFEVIPCYPNTEIGKIIESRNWEKTIRETSTISYKNYLEKYPNGRHSDAAIQALKKLELEKIREKAENEKLKNKVIKDMANYSEFLSLGEDELLIEIGRALDKDSLDAFPKPISILKQRAEKFITAQKNEYRDLICNSKSIQALASEGFTPELVAAVIGLIESITIGAAVSPIAILLCKRGIVNFCSVHWSETK